MTNLLNEHHLTRRQNNAVRVSMVFLFIFFIIYPFLSVFFALEDAFPEVKNLSMISSCANYFGVIFAFYIAFKNNFSFSARLIELAICMLILLALNYFFSSYAQASWLMNWIAFIFFAVVFSQIINRLSYKAMESFQLVMMNWLLITARLLCILIFFVWLINIEDLIYYLSTERLNNIIAILTKSLGVQKQNLGTFYSLLIFSSISFWQHLTNLNRSFLCIAFLIFLPSILGINTLHLAVSLCIIWIFITKNRTRKLFLFFSIMLFIPIVLMYWQEIMIVVQTYYDRLPSLQFSLSTIGVSPFGLGNGGYEIYVEKHNNLLLHSFASGVGVGAELMNKRNEFWLAPESDLVYFFASWGVLSIPFFSYFIFMLYKGGKLFHRMNTLLPVERLMLLMMAYMIFAGISQDNAGKLLWWIYMASGLGVLLRHNFGRDSQNSPFIRNLTR